MHRPPHLRSSAFAAAVISLLASGGPAPAATAAPDAAAKHVVQCVANSGIRSTRRIAYSKLPLATSFTKRVAAAGGQVVDLGKGRYSFTDFTAADGTFDGAVADPAVGGLIGSGASRTTLQVRPYSSTHAKDIPRTFPNTNQLSVLRVSGKAAVLRGFTVNGTKQGHLYNGLRIDRVRGLRASHLRITHIPGNDSAPPGETFGINDYRTVGSRWSHIVVDGKGVGASGFGVNGSRNITICDATSRNNPTGMGFAFWQSSGIRLVDSRAVDNGFSGFNFERTTGIVVLVRPAASGNRYGMRIASDRSSAKFRIVDPRLNHGRWTVTLPKRWYGTTNKQRRSDITLVVNGKSRPDLLRIVTY